MLDEQKTLTFEEIEEQKSTLESIRAINNTNFDATEREGGDVRHEGRRKWKRINDLLNTATSVLSKLEDLGEVEDPDLQAAKDACASSFLSDNMVAGLMDAEVMARIARAKKGNVEGTGPKWSFDPDQWFLEYEEMVKVNKGEHPTDCTEAGWNGLFKTRWALHAPHIINYLLDKSYVPPRKSKDRPDMYNAKTFAVFNKIKDCCRLSENTGLVHFLAGRDPPDVKGEVPEDRYSCRRVVTDTTKLKDVFRKYWADVCAGGYKKSGTVHKQLQALFLGVPHNQLSLLIKSTVLDQIQRSGNTLQKVTNPLETSEPMEQWQMDLMIMPEADKEGYQYVLVVVDLFSKMVWTSAMKDKTAKTVRKRMRHLFMTQGVPIYLQSDNGGEFTAKKSLAEWTKWNIQFVMSKVYRPTSQGQVERVNREYKTAWHQDELIMKGRSNWRKRLAKDTFRKNTTQWKSTGFTPWMVHYRWQMDWMPNPTDAARNQVMESVYNKGLVENLRIMDPDITAGGIRAMAADYENNLMWYNQDKSEKDQIRVRPPPPALFDKEGDDDMTMVMPVPPTKKRKEPEPLAVKDDTAPPLEKDSPTYEEIKKRVDKERNTGPDRLEPLKTVGVTLKYIGPTEECLKKDNKGQDINQPMCAGEWQKGCDEQLAFALDGLSLEQARKKRQPPNLAQTPDSAPKYTDKTIQRLIDKAYLQYVFS